MTGSNRFLCAVILSIGVLSIGSLCRAAVSDPATIIFVRHAEKSATTGDVPLSGEGKKRAELLAWMLKPAKITHIFSSELLRTRETAALTARAANLEVKSVPAKEEDALVEHLKDLPRDAVALVVGHSSTVPKIIEKLGAGKIAPIAEDDFDRLIVVVRSAQGFHAVSLQYRGP